MATPGPAPNREEQNSWQDSREENRQETQDRNREDSREVIIKVSLDANGDVQVDEKYFFVSKSGNQEVHWVCAQDHDHTVDPVNPCFSVEFDENNSPFYEYQFNSDVPVSGLVRRDVLPSTKNYEYTVRIGDKKLDPGGGVKK